MREEGCRKNCPLSTRKNAKGEEIPLHGTADNADESGWEGRRCPGRPGNEGPSYAKAMEDVPAKHSKKREPPSLPLSGTMASQEGRGWEVLQRIQGQQRMAEGKRRKRRDGESGKGREVVVGPVGGTDSKGLKDIAAIVEGNDQVRPQPNGSIV